MIIFFWHAYITSNMTSSLLLNTSLRDQLEVSVYRGPIKHHIGYVVDSGTHDAPASFDKKSLLRKTVNHNNFT
jgi:hypothetical protein